jgi:glycosyltransferase involved in cell wall biosynthesis
MKVLFLSHTGAQSGAEVAMLRLIEGLSAEVERVGVCPPGRLADSLRGLDVAVQEIPGTAVNLRLDPRRTASGVSEVARSARELARIARSVAPDVIHANTVRAGLIAAGPRLLGGPPLLVVSHDHLPPSLVSRAARSVVSRAADHVIADTAYTARNFNEGLRRKLAEPVYLSVDHRRFRPTAISRGAILERLGIDSDGPVLGEVAQITPWKGQDVAVRAFARVRERFPGAQLLLIGSISFDAGTRYDNVAFLSSLEGLIADLGVGDSVHLLGQRDDVPELMAALDLHLLPSWDEPFGTATAEAMAVGAVPLVTSVGGMPEYVEDGVCGRVLPPREPDKWAAAAIELLEDQARLAAMSQRAREVASQFTIERYSREVQAAWQTAIARARGDFNGRGARGAAV